MNRCECEIYQVCVECVGQEEYNRVAAQNKRILSEYRTEQERKPARESSKHSRRDQRRAGK